MAWGKHLNVWFLDTFPFVCGNCSRLENGVFTGALRMREYVQVLFLPIIRRAGGRPSSRPPLLCPISLWSRSRPSMPLTWSVSWSLIFVFQAQIDLEILNFQHCNISIKMIPLCHSTQKHPAGAECLSPDLCSVIPLSRYRPERWRSRYVTWNVPAPGWISVFVFPLGGISVYH